MLAASQPCTLHAARQALLAAPALRSLRSTVEHGGGPDTLICHDLTGDGADDMAVTVFSGGTAGDIAWAVFRPTGAGWKLAYARLHAYKVGLYHNGRDLIESEPIYRPGDPNCCPTGGFERRRLSWNGRTFVVTSRGRYSTFAP